MSHTASIDIDRPASVVFMYMDDVSLEHEWQPALESAEQDPPGPSGVGTRKSYVSSFMKKRVENTYVVKEIGPGWRVVYETTPDSSIEAVTEVVLEDRGTSTRVTWTVDARPTGVLKMMPAAVLERAAREQLEETLERLKEAIEARPL